MLPRDIIRQVRRLQLRARRAVQNLFGGEYHSVFKGSGVAFDEVRAYQPGDEVRHIDWNVTARVGQPFIKRHVEERERTVLLAVDTSASLAFGTGSHTKREVAAELAAVVAFSAISNNDRVGLLQFTDHIEHYLPPRKGSRHVLRLIRDVLFFEPTRRATSLREGLDHLNRVQRKRAIVFLFSDFLDADLDRVLQRTARRHDLIAVHLEDPRERMLPNVGLVELEDTESGGRLLVDTSSAAVRHEYAARADRRENDLAKTMRGAGIDRIRVSTDGDHLEQLVRFFRARHRRAKGRA
jgi:uncharacterized protein (DUF58 family)